MSFDTLLEQQNFLLERDNSVENVLSVWIGADETTATQLLNRDGSKPYVRQVSVNNEMLAYDAKLQLDSEIYRVTWVHSLDFPGIKPDANAAYWISIDGGITKDKVDWSYRRLRNGGAYWWIFLKNA